MRPLPPWRPAPPAPLPMQVQQLQAQQKAEASKLEQWQMAADALMASLQLDIGHLRAQLAEVQESCRCDLQHLEQAISSSKAETRAYLDEQLGVRASRGPDDARWRHSRWPGAAQAMVMPGGAPGPPACAAPPGASHQGSCAGINTTSSSHERTTTAAIIIAASAAGLGQGAQAGPVGLQGAVCRHHLSGHQDYRVLGARRAGRHQQQAGRERGQLQQAGRAAGRADGAAAQPGGA
jgi:hypothetical protein